MGVCSTPERSDTHERHFTDGQSDRFNPIYVVVSTEKAWRRVPGTGRFFFYHPHLGEIDQTLLGEVWGPLLDEGQVGEVHAQVRDTRRVTAKRRGKMLEL